jgi:hypothetical protein
VIALRGRGSRHTGHAGDAFALPTGGRRTIAKAT